MEQYEEVVPSALERGAFLQKLASDGVAPAAKETPLKQVSAYLAREDERYHSLKNGIARR